MANVLANGWEHLAPIDLALDVHGGVVQHNHCHLDRSTSLCVVRCHTETRALTSTLVEVSNILLTVLGFVVGLALSFRSSTAYERYTGQPATTVACDR